MELHKECLNFPISVRSRSGFAISELSWSSFPRQKFVVLFSWPLCLQPLQCFRCQRLGHISKKCKHRCVKCAGNHSPGPLNCINCKSNHPTNFTAVKVVTVSELTKVVHKKPHDYQIDASTALIQHIGSWQTKHSGECST